MLSLLQDLRYSARAFLKAPWFAMLAIVTLALGIAVNTTIFSVVNGFLLRPLPVAHPEQLVVLSLQQGGDHALQNFSYPDYVDLRAQSGSAFAELAGYRITLRSLTNEKVGDHSLVTRVTGNYFSMLGIQPALGRLILPTEGQVPGADPVIVLGYSYWQKRFAGDKNVLGKHVELGGHPMTIVGVAPKDFHGTYFIVNSDLYVPLSADIAEAGDTAVQDTWTQRADRSLTLMGRLKPGTGLKQAEAALNLVAQRIASQHPDTDKAISVRAFAENRARPDPDPDNTLAVLALAFMGLAALVLLVACFNVTNVLLARATSRQREMAIRSALGAGRARLVQQFLTESLLLAGLGAGLGLLLTFWATQFLSAISLGTDLPIQLNFLPDVRVYLFAICAAVLTGIIVGVIPALRVARRDVSAVLHEGGRGSSDGRRRQFARGALVVAQVAGSLVLLVVAGLFIRSLGKAEKMYLGLDPNNVLNFSVDVQQAGYAEVQGRAFYSELESRVRNLPGVVAVGQAFTVPLGVMSSFDAVTAEGQHLEAGQVAPAVQNNSVNPQYFEALRIPVHRGRVFTDADDDKAPGVAIINETMAKKFWPEQDAVGKRFSVKGAGGPFLEVVGIVQDGKYRSVVDQPQPLFYRPLSQSYLPMRTFHVRTSVPPESLAALVQEQVRELAPTLPVSQVQTMEEALQGVNGFLFFRLGAQLTGVMGVLGLILAVVGVYSVASYAAAQRTQEIGIRMAVGAAPADILKMVLRQGFVLAAVGIVVGLAAAFAGTRLLADQFYGVTPSDPLTYVGVALLIISVALFACGVPAYRATRVSPLAALRLE
jgi:macrolide transport system ATP-binding/permease protein